MIVCFDTSALLKRYVIEAGSEAIAALWKQSTASVASQILYGLYSTSGPSMAKGAELQARREKGAGGSL